MTQTQTPFGEPGISVTDESIQATASFSEAFNDLAVLRLVDEPLQEPFRLSDLTHELCQHIEREYARHDHSHRASRSLSAVVREHLCPIAARHRSEHGGAHVKELLEGMTDELHKCVVPRARSAGEPDLPRTAVNAEGKDVLPYHFGQQKHLILESVCKVVEDVKAEYAGAFHIPRPDLQHLVSSNASSTSANSKRSLSGHHKDLSLNSLKRIISPPLDPRSITRHGIDFPTVPIKAGHPSPRHALDVLTEGPFHHESKEEQEREEAVWLAGIHRAADVRELFV